MGDDVSKKKLDSLDSSFIYTQILNKILLTIHFEKKHRTAFLDYCDSNNIKILETIKHLFGDTHQNPFISDRQPYPKIDGHRSDHQNVFLCW